MTVLYSTQVWVGAERRTDSFDRTGYPQGYVTLTTKDGDEVQMTPEAARYAAKALKAFADFIDPPKPRKKRTA